MIPQNVIEQITALPVLEVVQDYVKLKKSGANWLGPCPFHHEKSSSLSVSPAKNIFKCFGCGMAGNATKFVMEVEKVSFIDACRKLAQKFKIDILEESLSPDQKAAQNQIESLYIVNSFAGSYFKDCLYLPEHYSALEYARGRWSEEILKRMEIGFAPESWDGLINAAKKAGMKSEFLFKAGLIKESQKMDGRAYDFFRNRLMIPIHDKYGRIIGFTGRSFDPEAKAKYLNTPETPVYYKSKALFGLNWACHTIKNKGFAYLVEGNADVIRLHQIGILETVASSGTALSREQILELKKLCNSITIIGDTDKAGQMAVDRSARLIIEEGMNCNVIRLPSDEGEKVDPDSYFTDEQQFKETVKTHIRDYIVDLATQWQDRAHAPDFKLRAIEEISGLISKLSASSHEVYIEQVGRLIKPKKAFKDKIREILRDNASEEIHDKDFKKIPDHVSLVDWDNYGFYEDNNCYFFDTSKGIIRGCNFVLKPLFHIESTLNAKRLFTITNHRGKSRVIELPQKDLVSLVRFKERIESLGNFLWEASEVELNRLKRFLYEETESCLEITQLGWQKDQFFAWGNGIFNSRFTSVDENGIVKHEDTNFYLPAFSRTYANELGLFINERQFIHRDTNTITLNSYSEKLIGVFGPNASIALCFFIASLFRDVIVGRFHFFPILNLFGPKGAGKTELAVSLMSFFGRQGKGPNINNTSKAALADHVATVANACVHIDEYKNNIEPEKIEFLKGLWDGTGRTRMNMDKDKKKETTAVDCGVILSGQEMPTADIALFSRLVYLTFTTAEFDEAAKARFNELKQIEQLGNTHITNEILGLRSHFIVNFATSYDQVAVELNKILEDVVIEDRIFRNWLILLASFHAIRKNLKVAFSYEDLIGQAASQIQLQNVETKRSSEVANFWNMVNFLASDGLIQQGIDYKIECQRTIETDVRKTEFEFPVNVLLIQMSRIYLLYRKHGKSAGDKVLPTDSIDYYLRNDKRYYGKKRTRFRFIDPTPGQEGVYQTKPQWAYCFDYDKLEVSLHTEDQSEKTSITKVQDEPKKKDSQSVTGELPF